jgi:hypothetical protein
MNRKIALNVIFLVLTIFFLILSFMIDFFFFIPIICFLPFPFRSTRQTGIRSNTKMEEYSPYEDIKNQEVRHCSKCGGEISQSIARFCYHCGEKLNSI